MIEAEIIVKPALGPQIEKLAGYERIADEEFRKALGLSSLAIKAGWQNFAPIDTRKYVLSIGYEIKPLGGELRSVIGTNVASALGFPYPKALEESTRYHYRKTRFRGQETAGQIAKAVAARRKQVDEFFSKAIDRIIKRLRP